ncbi:glutamate racemase [Hazenella sp. IB182357]|uniref:Glutamate racemase n=1 Tax=Polycladospora coralii TaxID=2771432 RepID=A0A926NE82_9BACL|nr:glutamate racemase [Polycladospora coralii]MBD1371823.1 glutamate racemase [Polycladospora coralii]
MQIQPQKNEYAIGIIDSGVGGLTVAKEVMRQLPLETIYYFGDSLRCPYGPRSETEVFQFTKELVAFLMQFPLKALLIACNTATAVSLVYLKKKLSIPVLGVIDPGARAAIKASKNKKIGVIGTVGTIKSGAYEKSLKRIQPTMEVHSLACPNLVPLVESGNWNGVDSYDVVAESLAPLPKEEMDTLILGCTHYPLLTQPITQVMGENIAVISSAEETASELSTILYHQNLLAQKQTNQHRFFTTGSSDNFARIASDWLGKSVYAESVSLSTMKDCLA